MEDKGFAPWLSSETGLIKRRVVFFWFAGQSFSPRGFDWVFTVFPLVSRNRHFSCASTLCHIHVSCCFGWCVQFLVDYILFLLFANAMSYVWNALIVFVFLPTCSNYRDL